MTHPTLTSTTASTEMLALDIVSPTGGYIPVSTAEAEMWRWIAAALHHGFLRVIPVLTPLMFMRFEMVFGQPDVRKVGRGAAARAHRIAMCLLLAAHCELDGYTDYPSGP